MWRRLKENREKYADDTTYEKLEDNEVQLDNLITTEGEEVSEE